MSKKIYIAINLDPFNSSGFVNFNFCDNKVKVKSKVYGQYSYFDNDTETFQDYYFDSKVNFYIKKNCNKGKIKCIKIIDLEVNSSNNVNPADHTDEYHLLYDVDGNLCENEPLNSNCGIIQKNIYNSLKNLILNSNVSINNNIGTLTINLNTNALSKITILDMCLYFKNYKLSIFYYITLIKSIFLLLLNQFQQNILL